MRAVRLLVGTMVLLTVTPTLAQTRPAKPHAPPTAKASDPDEAAAAQLKAEGDRAFELGRPGDALRFYESAYAKKRDTALVFNQARAQQALTHYTEALALYERFKAEADGALLARVPALDRIIGEMRGRVHDLTIRCSVEGARIRLNGQVLGPSPISLRVDAGTHQIDGEKPGYRSFSRAVVLAGGVRSDLDIVLEPEDKTGTLRIRTSPIASRVSVDSVSYGDAPLELKVAEGAHAVVVSSDGFRSVSTQIVVTAGQTKESLVELEKNPSLLGRWWFWTGVAVVVAGGVVLAVALTTEKSAGTGSIAPGQVSDGLTVRF